MQRSSSTSLVSLLCVLILLICQNGGFFRVAEGGKKKVHIPDDLDDVADDEEDEDWRKWGEKSKNQDFNPPQLDPDTDPMQFQAELMKRHAGPTFGFVKLRPGVKRSPEMVGEIAMKWTRVLKTGSIEAKFVAVDLNTLMFTLEKGQETPEVIDFVFGEHDAYELKIADQVHRRPGDPPLPSFDEMEETSHQPSPVEEQKHPKDEL